MPKYLLKKSLLISEGKLQTNFYSDLSTLQSNFCNRLRPANEKKIVLLLLYAFADASFVDA